MCWNHAIWFCFHREKCKKQKKMRRFLKSFTSYLNNGSTSEHNSTRFGKLQWRATTFVFDNFWWLVMWPTSQHPIGWMLTSRIIVILFFFTFWSNQMIFPFWDGPWRQCLWLLLVPWYNIGVILECFNSSAITHLWICLPCLGLPF